MHHLERRQPRALIIRPRLRQVNSIESIQFVESSDDAQSSSVAGRGQRSRVAVRENFDGAGVALQPRQHRIGAELPDVFVVLDVGVEHSHNRVDEILLHVSGLARFVATQLYGQLEQRIRGEFHVHGRRPRADQIIQLSLDLAQQSLLILELLLRYLDRERQAADYGDRRRSANLQFQMITKIMCNNVAVGKQKRLIRSPTNLHLVYDTPSVLDALDLEIFYVFRQQKLVENF